MTEGLTIAARSWKRADSAFTHRYFSDVQYVVCESQADAYRANGLNVWQCPDGAQGNICRVSNWIMDNCPTKWLLILDDDLTAMGRWNGNSQRRLSEAEAIEEIEQGFEMAEALGAPFWGVNCIPDKGAYREYTPLSFNNYIGGPFQAFDLDKCSLRYDENLPLKEDYDMTLQAANKYRRVLRINFLHYIVKQHTNKGGCADYRTLNREKEQFTELQKKWGGKIVRRDSGNSKTNRKKQAAYDINPIIRIPIGGV